MTIAIGMSEYLMKNADKFIEQIRGKYDINFIINDNCINLNGYSNEVIYMKDIENNSFDIFIDTDLKKCEDVYYHKKGKVPCYLLQTDENRRFRSKVINRCYSWDDFAKEIKYLDKK